MEIAFDTKKLRDLCENEQKARRELGKDNAERLKRRLADLRAAETVNDLVVGNVREATAPTERTINFSRKATITFCSNHANHPQLRRGGIDWSRVTRIRITEIENVDD